MPTVHDIHLLCEGPEPEETNAGHHQEVKFINDTESELTITFCHPGIFSPTRGAVLVLGAGKWKQLRINQIKNGTGFSYTCVPDNEFSERAGRIDPL